MPLVEPPGHLQRRRQLKPRQGLIQANDLGGWFPSLLHRCHHAHPPPWLSITET